MSFPCLQCDLSILLENVNRLAALLHGQGRHFAAVTKAVCAAAPIVDMLNRSDCDSLADARLMNLASMRTTKPRMLIRPAQHWEIADAVEYSDMSFESEISTIELLAEEAARRGRRHGVILALDMGDLREGCYFRDEADILKTAEAVLRRPSLELLGVGTNLGCFGGVRTTEKNMTALCHIAERLRSRFGVPLPFVSGMTTAAQRLLHSGTMPAGVNHGRFGEAWLLGWDSVEGCAVPELRPDAFTFSAQLIEVKTKDSKPVGEIGGDAFGHVTLRPDLGLMRRGLLACGAQDVERECLLPTDGRISIIGGSSDHTIVRLDDAPELGVGDVLHFHLRYGALLRASTSPYVKKEYIGL